MSAAAVVAAVAFLTAVVALVCSVRAGRSVLATQADLASTSAALDQERRDTAEAIAVAHRSTIEEVATLLENALTQVDTEVTVKVAEALALLGSRTGSEVGETRSQPRRNPHP